jgi:hypothetical protein
VTFSRQFVQVNTSGPDQEGCLLFDENGALVAIVVKLSGQHEVGTAGKWFLEHGFGSLEFEHPTFDSVEDAETWLIGMLG